MKNTTDFVPHWAVCLMLLAASFGSAAAFHGAKMSNIADQVITRNVVCRRTATPQITDGVIDIPVVCNAVALHFTDPSLVLPMIEHADTTVTCEIMREDHSVEHCHV